MHYLNVKLEIVDEEGTYWGDVKEKLVVTNIPQAWSLKRMNPKDNEKEGVGISRLEAVADWLHKNYGPKMIETNHIPAIVLKSFLDEIKTHDLGNLILEALKKTVDT